MTPIRQKRSRRLFFCLVLMILSTLNAYASEGLIGKKAPELSGKDAMGKGFLKVNRLMRELSYLKDAEGKFIEKEGEYVPQVTKNVVVLNFFATYCVPCIKEIPAYNRLRAVHF
ncbi:hypothetical protein WDW89_20810 [Deltaproteobacteria bacterium TL4]